MPSFEFYVCTLRKLIFKLKKKINKIDLFAGFRRDKRVQ